MSEILKNHIGKFVELSEEEFAEVFSFFRITEVKKKENLLKEGQVCSANYFVLEGCLRKFFIDAKVAISTHLDIPK